MFVTIPGMDSSVVIATRCALGGRGIESRWWRDFPTTSRPALDPPILLYRGNSVSFPGVKQPGAWRWPFTTSRVEVKKSRAIPLLPFWDLVACSRVNSTLLYFTVPEIRISLKGTDGSGLLSRSLKFSVRWKLTCHYAKYSGEWCVML